MDDFLRELPKAELHLHLEGSVEPETLYELDPSTPLEEYRALYHYTDFDAFLRAFGVVGKRLRTPADYALITRRLLERLAAQNVQYAEIIIAAGVVLWKEQDFAPIFDARPRRRRRSRLCEVRWILDAVRQFGVGAGDAGGRIGRRTAGSGRGGARHRRQRRARPGRVVQGRLRLRQERGPASARARRREHGPANPSGTRWISARSASATASRRSSDPRAAAASARARHPARNLHHQQSRDRRGGARGGSSRATPVRCRACRSS